MDAAVCISCQRPKASVACGVCAGLVCKKCVVVLEKDSFLLLEAIPSELSHKHYCGTCFDREVAPTLAAYHDTLRRAKAVFVFLKSKSEETRLLSRSEKPIRIAECADEQEALMRLAYLAAKANYNALIDVEITAKKVRNAGYQTTRWQGTGIPTKVDAEKLNRQDREERWR